ncbi:MAG TPA: hypothetical protein VNO30_50350 [Kofleriaceae bacterium]|nr:hypothetical protein [Kofleriaceae bacterium]
MRSLAMLVALALAPASVASADPPYRGGRDSPSDREHARDREPGGYRYDRYDEGYYERGGRRVDAQDRRRWAPIVERSSATSARQFINVLGRGGRYRRLLVEGVRGAPVIERVAVEFEDRQTQVWDVGRRLPRGADHVIQLGGAKRIHRIVVYTDPAHRGQYSIYGA